MVQAIVDVAQGVSSASLRGSLGSISQQGWEQPLGLESRAGGHPGIHLLTNGSLTAAIQDIPEVGSEGVTPAALI